MTKFLPPLLVLWSSLVYAISPLDYENNPKFEEIYRLKIWNQPGGTIEVSRDEGKNWETLGKVIYPTQKVNPEGYTAARWVGDGKVAATAVNAIHIKTSTEADGGGVIFSVLPKEFLKKPKVYKSYLSPDSSIYTDIPAGEGIFGGGYAPFVGNVVMVSQLARPVVAIPKGYVPQISDKIYVMVDRPVDYPKEMIFENKFGGKITTVYFNGEEKVSGQVLRPVVGVGRFDGTKYASVGRIRANHAGVIDISTSSLGKIGGFQIVPAQHGSGMQYARENTQWMVVGPADVADPSLEGRAPFFKFFIKPAYGESDLESEDWDKMLLDRFLVEVKVKDKDKVKEGWQPMPDYEFNEYNLVGEVPDWANSALAGITHFRIMFPIEN